MKKNVKNKIGYSIMVLLMALTFGSCEDYLDKAPESTIAKEDCFSTFQAFQGWVEQMHMCVMDYNHCLGGITQSFCFADEVLCNTALYFDDGNYWNTGRFLTGSLDLRNNVDPGSKHVWPLAWYGIRKANQGLENLDLLSGTQEEKDFIKGQCLFFRAWFHFEMMRYWGGLPYINKSLTLDDDLKLARLTYHELALKIAEDFKEAAALLPLRWDDTEVGKRTLGDNSERVTKIHALAFLAKNYLYAGSPAMNESSTGNANFDVEFCKKAADTFAEVIKICDETGAYKLLPWENWQLNFWIWSTTQRSGGSELIMAPYWHHPTFSRWTTVRTSSPVQFAAGNSRVEVPTHNYVKNYGMANGLPIDDPQSGYDPADPWANRDPRFYLDIVVDGDKMANNNSAGMNQYAQLFTGGLHQGGSIGSVTGYFRKKWTPLGCNPWDNKWGTFSNSCAFMRLADVYLMYAEAVLQGYGTPQSKVPGSITAEEAVNIIRNRAKLPNLESRFTSTKEAFWQELIRERAVELAFEAHRFFDLRRWLLSGELKYKEKTAIDFDRGANGKPVNMKERVVLTRVYEPHNKWFPLSKNDINNYPAFTQNPGY